MFFRYLIISPSGELRQAFLGGIFGEFELAPKGRGETARMRTQAGDELEIIGVGNVSKLKATGQAIINSGIRIDAVLMLLPSGDGDSWEEIQLLTEWLKNTDPTVPVKTWVVNSRTDIEKESSRKILLELMDEHERAMRFG